ncbi:MAG: ABC transporter ATP-binding protein [Chloroflexi bacterium]|nr:ABC transporter ATP-binding protein [Chloroflexota bacterium]
MQPVATPRKQERGRPVPPPPSAEGGALPISTRGLTKRYGDLVAVDGLDLDVVPGEIFGLLGQNGAGKTTTILMLLGLTEPSGGWARVAGFDPTRQPLEVKRRVGYLPDAVGFYGAMSGRANLRYTARLNRLERVASEARIEEVLEQVGMANRADDRVDTYSRGMLQRLGIADALLKDPAVLILDEPTTAIDPIGVVEILELLRGLARKRGLAILLSSHLLTQVQSVCDRVGIFAAGRLIGVGTVPELALRFGEPVDLIEVGAEGEADPSGAISAMPGFRSIVAGERPGDPFVVRVDRGSGATLRAAVLAAAAAGTIPLTSVREVVPSLDDIYRRALEERGLAAHGRVAA